ncbi:MAG: hypothetical protein VX875_07825 [Pseudomonadota bacterium]|jgi:hypothetical protein|nr:hypothetical protein [Pseudomonadota bacterium]
MQVKSVMLMLSMTVGFASYTHSARIQPQTPKQEASIIKSVADAKKTTATAKGASQLTALDKLIQSAKLSAASKPSTEESQALAKLNNQKLSVVSRSKKFSNLFQNLFGS